MNRDSLFDMNVSAIDEMPSAGLPGSRVNRLLDVHCARWRQLARATACFFVACAFLTRADAVELQFSPGSTLVLISGQFNPLAVPNPPESPTFSENFEAPVIDNDGYITLLSDYGDGLVQLTPKRAITGLWNDRPAPNGGVFAGFSSGALEVNGRQETVFLGGSRFNFTYSGPHVFLISKPKVSFIALNAAPAPGNGTFTGFDAPSLNDSGAIVFHATSQGGATDGIYLAPGMPPTPVALKGDLSLDGSTFSEFESDVAINNAGTIAFQAATTGGPPGVGDNGKVHLHNATGNHPLAGGQWCTSFMLNEADQVVLNPLFNEQIYLATASTTTPIVSQNDPAPGGSTFFQTGNPVLNNHGQVAFVASLNDAPDIGVYLWSQQDGIKKIAVGGPAPDGGTFTGFNGTPVLNEKGQVAFVGNFGINDQRIFMGDGTDLFKVIGNGDKVVGTDGFTWTIIDVALARSRTKPGHNALNDNGELVYRARFQHDFSGATATGIFLFTPGLYWRGTVAAGDWETAANWTFDTAPSSTRDVNIAPATDVVVTGPGTGSPAAVKSVKSLIIAGGGGAAELNLQPDVTLAVKNGVTLANKGTISGAGTIDGRLTMQAGATIALQINNNLRGNKRGLLKAGATVLAGTLEVTAGPGFAPGPGDTFDLLELGKTTGTFTAIHLPALGTTGLVWDAASDPKELYKSGRITVVMATDLRGSYAGLVQAAPIDVPTSGFLTISVMPTGVFTGKVSFGGANLTLGGFLDSSGQFHLKKDVIDKAGHHLTNLQLDLTQRPGHITGTIVDAQGAFVANVTSDRTPTYSTKGQHSPDEGTYTFTFPTPFPGDLAKPQGTGYATLKVDATGKGALAGVLGDGTPLTLGGMVTEGRKFPVYKVLNAKAELVSGAIALHGSAADDLVDGAVDWVKTNTAAKKPFPATFSGQIAVVGSGYVAPTPGNLILPTPRNFSVSDGGVDPITPVAVSIGTASKASFDLSSALKSMTFTTKTGLFAGKFKATFTSSQESNTPSYSGVVLQLQKRAAGVFKGDAQTGSVELK